MKVDVLLGLQWGDEGKGKIVDFFTPNYEIVARFQGGPNAGHTLEFDGLKMVLHTIPSGIFRDNSQNLIGNGVVIDPIILKREIEGLLNVGVPVRERLLVSKKTHLILPTHPLLDAANEKAKGDKKIGSTLKGIGPTYMDKIGRHGLRLGTILSDNFSEIYNQVKSRHLETLDLMGFEYDLTEAEAKWLAAIEFIKELNIIDSEQYMFEAVKSDKRILAEGAQGSLLDIDFGSYPFVTSSNTITAGACTGLGIAPSAIGEVFGIVKAYCTRVGSGPFPTELFDETGEQLRQQGREFGSTTGRPRRCGWLDIPALKYAVQLSGVTQLIVTKPDVLSKFETLKVCRAYKLNGKEIDYMPFEVDDLEPIYDTLPGWNEDLTGLKNYPELPKALHEYLDYIENAVGVPIKVVSVGPDRVQTIFR